MYKINISSCTLHFLRPAGTSRVSTQQGRAIMSHCLTRISLT